MKNVLSEEKSNELNRMEQNFPASVISCRKHTNTKLTEGDNMPRRIISIILALAVVFSFAACGSDNKQEETAPSAEVQRMTNDNASAKEPDAHSDLGATYSKELLMHPDASAVLLGAVKADGAIYMYGTFSSGEQVLYKMDIETRAFERIDIPQSCEIHKLFATSDGSAGLLCFGENGEYILYSFKESLGWSEQTLPMLEEYENDIITQIYQTTRGFVVFTTDSILLLDADGNQLKKLGGYAHAGACFLRQDGAVVIIAQAEEGIEKTSELKTTVLGEDFEVLESYKSSRDFTAFYDTFNDGSILAQKADTAYKYDYISDTAQPLVNTSASGMSPNSIITIDDESLFSINSGRPYIWHPQGADGVTALTLGAYNPEVILLDYINTYNEKSTKYKINVLDYAAYDENNDGQGLTRLRTDIISGNVPDIYDLSNLPAELYARRGILEYLTPYFSETSAVSYEEFTPGAIKALETNGGLYYITPTYEVLSVCGDVSFVGDKGSWTPQDFFAATANVLPADVFGPETTKTTFLSYLLTFMGDEYIDKETLQCHFDEESFARFLEFAAQLPDEYQSDAAYSSPSARAYVGKQPILLEQIGVSAISFLAFADTIFNGNAQYVGFPTSSSSGVAMMPHSVLAMSSQTQSKDGVMDFIYFLLSEPMQKEMPFCPIIKDVLADTMEQWEKDYLEYPPTLYTTYDGASVEIEGKTDPETAKVRLINIIESVDCTTLYDEEILGILTREANPYFMGQIPVESAVANIQAKVKLYLAEQYG